MTIVRTRAPGRVNLLGEHTDYNDGFVLPCAIAYDTRVRAVARAGGAVRARSQKGSHVLFDLDDLSNAPRKHWSDYLLGVLSELKECGVKLRGCDVEISGNVPIGAGLSSSASLEVAFALAMLALAEHPMNPLQLALLAQRAEINFVGTRCGIMDQFTALHGRAGFAILLDTRSLDYRFIPLPPAAAIVICNTMVKHSLSTGAYNERRSQCEQAVSIIRQRHPGVRALRDVTPEMLQDGALPAPLLARARHVVTENTRVGQAVEALSRDDLTTFGDLMYASHASLRDDYEVSCAELDAMVDAARRFPGTIGSRMTGGGFGGCTVNLVAVEEADAFRRYMRREYAKLTGITPEIYDGTPSDGAGIVDE